MADFMNNPYWNLDLLVTTKSSAAAASTSTLEPVSPNPAANLGLDSKEIPISTIVYRAAEKMATSGSSRKSSSFEPLMLKLRYEIESFVSKLDSVKYLKDQTAKFTWAVSAAISAAVVIWVGYTLFQIYQANERSPAEPGKHPVIPVTPIDQIPYPPVMPPDPPKQPSKTTSRRQKIRDIRLKLFSEILSSFLTLIFFTFAIWGDTLVLQFLLCGLTGFVGLVALVLPDEADWSKGLYNYQEGGFEMADIQEREVKEHQADTKLDMSVLKEMRDKVVERIQESPTTKKAKDIVAKTKTEIKRATEKTAKPAVDTTENIEINRPGSADEDLKAQLSKITTPINEALKVDATIEKASKKVEEWLTRASDPFGPDEAELEGKPKYPQPRYPQFLGDFTYSQAESSSSQQSRGRSPERRPLPNVRDKVRDAWKAK